MTPENVVFISYGVPFVAINGLSAVSIVSIRKTLSATFFRIYILTLAVNLLTYLNSWLTSRLHKEQAFNFLYFFINDTVFVPFLQDFLIGFCFFAQNINSALLTFDRCAAVFPLKWLPRWQRWWWRIALALYVSSGVVYFGAAGFYNGKMRNYSYNIETDSFTSVSRKSPLPALVSSLQVGFGMIFILLCTILNVAVVIRVRQSTATNHQDRSLFFISLIVFLSQTFNVLIIVLYCYFTYISSNPPARSLVTTAMLYTSDVFSLGPGVVMMLVPGSIRSRGLSFLPVMKKRQAKVHSEKTVATTRVGSASVGI